MNFDFKKVGETDEFKSFKKDFENKIEFVKNFSELIWSNGRMISFLTDKNFHLLNTNLLDNSVQTLRSI
jgi:hypothetical protein